MKNLNTKMKLLLFPLMFIIIIVTSGLIYTYFSGIEDSRNKVALETEEFIQEVLKGRISVYQFLRNPVSENAQKVRNNFSDLDKMFQN